MNTQDSSNLTETPETQTQTDTPETNTPDPADLIHEQREKIFIEEISNGATMGAAAAKAGVHRSTVYRWLETDELFRGRVYYTLQVLSDAAEDRLTQVTRTAINILADLMDKPHISDSLRLRAAALLLGRLPRSNYHRHKIHPVLVPEEPPKPDPDEELASDPHFFPRPYATKRH